MSLYLGTTPIAKSAVSRNIGEIVQSTIPLTDAGLHLLDGSVIQRGSYADFVDYIAGLVTDYPDLFTTEANWQSSVSTYGVCGKFVYDSTNQTVRLPKITGFTEGTTDVTALGDLVEAGLPNITGSIGCVLNNGVGTTGAFGVENTTSNGGYSVSANNSYRTSFKASRSSSIYGNSDTVQPQSIKALYYIVVATSTKTQIEVDIDEVMTDLNGKADVDLSNINPTQTVKNTIVGWGMPDYSAGIGVSTPYTAPCDGYIFISFYTDRNAARYTIDGGNVVASDTGATGVTSSYMIRIGKGQKFVEADSPSALNGITFYPLKGV